MISHPSKDREIVIIGADEPGGGVTLQLAIFYLTPSPQGNVHFTLVPKVPLHGAPECCLCHTCHKAEMPALPLHPCCPLVMDYMAFCGIQSRSERPSFLLGVPQSFRHDSCLLSITETCRPTKSLPISHSGKENEYLCSQSC